MSRGVLARPQEADCTELPGMLAPRMNNWQLLGLQWVARI